MHPYRYLAGLLRNPSGRLAGGGFLYFIPRNVGRIAPRMVCENNLESDCMFSEQEVRPPLWVRRGHFNCNIVNVLEVRMSFDFKTISTYYDALYVKDADYRPESARVTQLLAAHGVPWRGELLVLACGTGGHIPYFKDSYNVSGLDLSREMLHVARSKFPDLPLHYGDMVDFHLEQEFDAVICMYGSIGFVRTFDKLRAATMRIAAHLRPDGVALITPWCTEECFEDQIVVDTAVNPEMKIARMERVRRKEPKLVEVTFHHLLGAENDVTYHTQSVELGLFSRGEYLQALAEAGLDVVEEYRGTDVRGGAFICKRCC